MEPGPEITGVLHSLKVLSLIEENDRVITRKGIHLDKCDNFFQPVVRWFNSENRKSNLQAITAVFTRAFECCDQLFIYRSDLKDKIALVQNTQMMDRLQTDIRSALNGIRNLKVTYANDAYATASITLMEDSVSDQLDRIHIQIEI